VERPGDDLAARPDDDDGLTTSAGSWAFTTNLGKRNQEAFRAIDEAFAAVPE
jgi:hypothetical protein